MRQVILCVMGLALALGLSGCKKAPVESLPAADPILTKITLDQALHGQTNLDHGWKVFCKTIEMGVYDATLVHGDQQVKLSLMRDAGFYGIDDTHVLIHNTWYSNDDQLLIVDVSAKDAEPVVVDHPDVATFVHTHYRIDGRTSEGVVGIEYQYAGFEGVDHPRKRTLLLLTNHLAQVKYGTWQEVEPGKEF